MKLASLHVLVVGGAIGGAATALLLARAGARVTLLEKVAHPRAVGAGLALADNGLAVLDSLGLLPAITRAAEQLDAPRITDARGRTLLAPPAARLLMIRRSDLHAVLLDALAAAPRVTTRLGAEVRRATTAGVVTFSLSAAAHATDAAEQTLAADLVVAADGVHSPLRAAGDFGATVRDRGIAYLRFLVDADVATGVEAWTGAGIFGAFPVPGGTYVYASAGSPATAAAVRARDLDALRAAWASIYPPAVRALAALPSFEPVLVNQVTRVTCTRWSDGRVVLLGDAAHAMPPNLGQGANSALVDAAVLLDELRRADTVPAALAAYQARRRAKVHDVARTAARLGALAELTHPLARFARDRLLMPVARLVAGDPSARVWQEPLPALRAIGQA